LVALRCAEAYFHEHPGNDFIFPRYGRANLGGIDVWLDVGLFTDPIYRWPLARIVIVFSIGCAVYTAICLPSDLARWRIRSRTTMGKAQQQFARRARPTNRETVSPVAPVVSDRSCPGSHDPAIVRVAMWVLCAIIGLYLTGWLLLPKIY
jgi:hypothetical protein